MFRGDFVCREQAINVVKIDSPSGAKIEGMTRHYVVVTSSYTRIGFWDIPLKFRVQYLQHVRLDLFLELHVCMFITG